MSIDVGFAASLDLLKVNCLVIDFTVLQEYSDWKEVHFNHSFLHYGICLMKSCDIQPMTTNSKDLNVVVEKCLNTSFWKEYKLNVKLNEDVICHSKEPIYHIETGDIVIAVVCFCMFMINLAGSVYDILIVKNDAGN